MEVHVQRDDLAEVLAIVTKASPSNTALPVLSGVYIDTPDNSTLRLACTDLQLFIEYRLVSENAVPGRVVVPAKLLTELIRKLPSGRISLVFDSMEEGLRIGLEGKSKTEFRIRTFDHSEFPPSPEMDADTGIRCTNSTLRHLIRTTAFAASTEESRAFLTGIYTTVEDGYLKMVATDSWRLAFNQAALGTDAGSVTDHALIPAKALIDLVKAIPDNEDFIDLRYSRTHACFEREDFRFITRLIEGQFPNYKGIMPKSHRTEVTVSRHELLSACERASLLIRDRVSLVKIANTMTNLVVTSSSPEMGQGYEEIPAVCQGDEITVVLDSKYLVDSLKAMQSDEIVLRLQGSQQAIFLYETDSSNYIQIIMPIKVPA